MIRIKFIKDFGVKRVEDVCEYDSSLCSQLVNNDNVAVYTTEPLTEVDEEREYLDPSFETDLSIDSKTTEPLTEVDEERETDKKVKKTK